MSYLLARGKRNSLIVEHLRRMLDTPFKCPFVKVPITSKRIRGERREIASARAECNRDSRPAQALCSSNLPKLLECDTPLFVAILGDLFPRKALPMPSHDSLHRGVAAAAKKSGLQPLEEQTTKIDQLYETMEVSTVPFLIWESQLRKYLSLLAFLCCDLTAHASHNGSNPGQSSVALSSLTCSTRSYFAFALRHLSQKSTPVSP